MRVLVHINLQHAYPVFILAFNAQMQPVDPDLITSVTFPEEGDTQITVPADAIRYQRSVEGMLCSTYNSITCCAIHMFNVYYTHFIFAGVVVPIVSFIAKNLQSYLYDQFTRCVCLYRHSYMN